MNVTERPPLVEAAAAESERLAGDPIVESVGYGLRRRHGALEYEVCIQYFVTRKLDTEDEIRGAGSVMIPAEIQGYPTDVRQSQISNEVRNEGPPTGSRGSQIEDPLIGGLSTTVLSDWHSFPTGFGTLGGLCFDAGDGTPLALSNAHVWGTDTGKDVIQPWMPTGEYLEAGVKLLTCGAAAFVADTTVPSPLTAGLAAAAAGAWVAAAASDSEDPSRWGQRTGPLPPEGATTTAEVIRVTAPVPDFPFAGRHYATRARWDYTRRTTAGDFSADIENDRPNGHLLAGKLVWTDAAEYRSGQRVQICADVMNDRNLDPHRYQVVALCYPEAEPSRLVYRVMRPGRCKELPRQKPICLMEFPEEMPSWRGSGYTAQLEPFYFAAEEPWTIVVGAEGTSVAGRRMLALSASPLRILVPPSTSVELEVAHAETALRVLARNSAGQTVASTTGAGQSDVETLTLVAPEIVEVVITRANERAALAGICVAKRPGEGGRPVTHIPDESSAVSAGRVRHVPYTGLLDLGLREPAGRWNIMLQVQSVDPSGPEADPIDAARILGGITASANVATVGCVTILLLDHVFDVI